ncbi:MAG TPA: hypothetical protein DCP91_05925 [Eggerthellaceae bacterium]|nr:hypothetical protein [Eggerthellaceae bacterium]
MSAKSVSTKAISVIVAIVAVLVASSLWVAPQAHAATDVYTNLIPREGDDLGSKQVTFNGHKWHIIEDHSTSAKEGSVTLLAADTSFGRRRWGDEGATDYNTSWAKAYLQGLVDSGEFKNVAYALKDTDYGKLYLLSIDEANAVPKSIRALYFRTSWVNIGYYVYGPWWLRSPGTDGKTVSFVGGSYGEVNRLTTGDYPGLDALYEFGIRPALQLDLKCVVFDPRTNTFGLKQYPNIFPTNNDRAEQLPDKQVNFNGRKWYVIDDNLTSPTEGTVTLLSADTSFGVSKFSDSSNDYASSDIKTYLDGLLTQHDEFQNVASVMKDTPNGKLYLLSNDELQNVPTSVMKADFTGGNCSKGEWWLRTGASSGQAIYAWGTIDGVNSVGSMESGSVTNSYGIRPAVQLDMSAVTYVADTKTFAPNTYKNLIPADDDGIDVRDQIVNFNGRKWVIIKDESSDPEKKSVTLFSADNSFGERRYDDASADYASSEIKAYFDEVTKTGEFKDVAFALKDTEYGKLYLLSKDDCVVPGSSPWRYIMPDEVGKLGFGEWWTRTGSDFNRMYFGYINGVGNWYITDGKLVSANCGVRPALQLDLTAVNYDPETKTFTAHKHDLAYSASGNTITATCKNADHKCKLPNCTTTLTIDAPTLTTYGQTGEGISADAVITDEGNIRGNATVDYYKVLNYDEGQLSSKLPAAPTAAGMYLAAISIIPNDETSTAYVVYTIEKADNPTSVESTVRVTKGGKTVDLADNVSLGGATGAVSYAIDGESLGCTISDEGVLTTGNTEGTVTVTVTVAEDDNYKALEGATITVNVADRDKQTIEAADVEVAYGDTDKAATAKVTSPAEGSGAISYAVKAGSEDYIAVDATTGALTVKKVPADGKAYIVVTAAETDTSEAATQEVTVTIVKASAVLPVVRANSWTADRTARPLVTADGLEAASGTTRFALGGNANNAPADSAYSESIPTTTDFGTYYVWYKVEGDENYNDSAPACVTVNVAAPASTGVDGLTYTISNTDEWNEFAWKVSNGTTFSGMVVQLTDDITVSTMAGRSDHRFQGIFDGGGHTLTFNCSTSDEYAAPFRFIEGAKFRDLKVDGTIETSKKYAAGFVGHTQGISSFTSCHSNITIKSSVIGDGTHGGFVAQTYDWGAKTQFADCLFDGRIEGEQTTNCGGFVGWNGAQNFINNGSHVTCTNCLNAGTFNTATDGCATFSRRGNQTQCYTNNSYYHTAYGTAQGTQTGETGEALKNLLGDGWMVSTVEGEDVIPVRRSSTQLTGDGVNEPYVISSVEEWDTFAQFVDDGISFDGKVIRLDADIAVTRMVGANGNSFKGIFNGNGHTLTFNRVATEAYVAPFRHVEGAKIINLTVAGTIQTSAQFAGGIVARSHGSSSFISCRSKVTIQSTASGDGTHGGLVAQADTEGCHTVFVDCLFDGSITGETTANCGGLLGWPGVRTASFTNCLNAGTFDTAKDGSGAFSGCGTFSRVHDANNIAIENCYYRTAYGTEQGTQTNETGEVLKNLLGEGWTVDADGKAGVVPGASDAVELAIDDYETVKFSGIEWIILAPTRTNGYLTQEAFAAGGKTAPGMLLLAKGSQGTTTYYDSASWCSNFYTTKINDNAKTAVLGVVASDGIDGTGSSATDKVFLLSQAEYAKYNQSSTASKMIPTISNPDQWWLRPGNERVGGNGGIITESIATMSFGARPAVNLKLDHVIVFDNTSPKTIKSFEEAVADDKADLQKTIDSAEATRDYVAEGYTNESKQAVTEAVAAGNECIAEDHQLQTLAETKAVLAEIAAKKAAIQAAESDLTVAAYDVPETGFTIRTGDEIRAVGVDLSASAAAGKAYGGNPMFRVLKVEDGRMLLASEYLWSGGKGSDSVGRVSFGGAGNAWQGSAAQGWAAAFGEDILGQVPGLVLNNVPGNVSDKAYSVPDGQASGGAFSTAESSNILTEQDAVFFLSGEEALEFMKQKTERFAKLYGEGGVDEASYWWLRSAIQGSEAAGYVTADGSAGKRTPSQGAYLRPAFWATMPDVTSVATINRSVESMEGTTRVVYTLKAIPKEDPVATPPAGLKATYGQTLADVRLSNPEGNTPGTWTWADDGATSVGAAGEHTFKANFTPDDTGKYNPVTGVDVAVTVAKAEVAAPEIASKTYTGEALTADVPDSASYRVALNKGGTDVGGYDVVLILTDFANCKWADSDDMFKVLEFQIAKAQLKDVSVGDVELTYTGQAQTPQPAASATAAGGQEVAFAYSRTEDGEYGAMPAFTDVADGGTVYFRASAPNHEDVAGSFAVTVGKAANKVGVSIEGWAAGEEPNAPAVTADFGADTATFQYKPKGADDSAYSQDVPTDPGEYTVRATVAGTDDYEAGSATADFTVGAFKWAEFTYSLSLQDSIDINFYMRDLKDDPSTYEVAYGTGDEGSEGWTVVEPASKRSNRYVIASRAAKEIGDEVRVVVKHNSEVIKDDTYSVKSYCDAVIKAEAGTYSAEHVDLCKATLDYGRYAQEAFKYNTDKLVNGGHDYFENARIEVPGYGAEKVDRSEAVDGVTLSLVTTAKTQLVTRFKCPEATSAEGYSATVDGQPAAIASFENGKMKVVVAGIAAKDLDEPRTIALTDPNKGTYTFTVSPVDYMGLAVSKESQVDLNRAFYNYHLKARAYAEGAAQGGAPAADFTAASSNLG